MLTTLAFSGLMLFAEAQQQPAPQVPPAKPVQAQGGFGGANLVAATTQAEPSPRIVEIKPDADGKVKITVMRPTQLNANVRPGAPAGRRIMVPAAESVELTDVKDLKITTAGGKEVKTADAIKALAKGGMVVVSADGKEVPTAMLKLFKEDVLVLVSPELVRGGGTGLVGAGGGGVIIPIGAPRNPGGNPGPAQGPAPAPKIN
jgi:hypothetical protein